MTKETKLEHDLQTEVIQYLRSSGAYVFRLNAGSFTQGGRMIKGLPKGFPDLMAFVPQGEGKPFKIVFIEMKKPKGKQSTQQVVTQALFEEWGVPYYLIQSLDDLKIIKIYER